MATQPVLAGTTLPWPSQHRRSRGYRGGTAIMADGTQITDLVQTSARRTWQLSWRALTSAGLGEIETAFDAIKDTSGAYTDLDGTEYTVTLDGMAELDTESVAAASGVRYDVALRLREA